MNLRKSCSKAVTRVIASAYNRKMNLSSILLCDVTIKYDNPNYLRTRIKLGVCELCGENTGDICMHHVKSLKSIKADNEWKMARGEMVRYMAEKEIENPADVQTFDRLGYNFRRDLSSEIEYVFERKIME